MEIHLACDLQNCSSVAGTKVSLLLLCVLGTRASFCDSSLNRGALILT